MGHSQTKGPLPIEISGILQPGDSVVPLSNAGASIIIRGRQFRARRAQVRRASAEIGWAFQVVGTWIDPTDGCSCTIHVWPSDASHPSGPDHLGGLRKGTCSGGGVGPSPILGSLRVWAILQAVQEWEERRERWYLPTILPGGSEEVKAAAAELEGYIEEETGAREHRSQGDNPRADN